MKAQKIYMRQREQGQSLVEMALGLIVIVILFSGLVDLGRAYYIYVALEDMAGEAALYLSINPPCLEDTTTGCADPNNARHRAEIANNTGLLNFDDVELIVDEPVEDRNEVSEDVNVVIRYPLTLITPILSQIAGDDGITLTVNASQLIITEYVVIP